MFNEHNTPAPTFNQKCYELHGIVYLPHYSMPSRFVAPGMKLKDLTAEETIAKTYSESELWDAGANLIKLPLWHRPSIDLKVVK